jgi:hypothetical protein
MPADPPARTPVTRRSLLAWGGVLATSPLLAGCGLDLSDVRLDDVPTPTPPVLGPDDLARFGAIERLTGLQQMASALATDTPPPRAQAVQVQAAAAEADHTVHLDQLGPLPGPVPSPSSTPEGWPSSTAAAEPGEPSASLLGDAEIACAVDLLGRVGETGGALARLLASIATSCGARGLELAKLAGSRAPAPLVPGTAIASLGVASEVVAEAPPADRTALEALVIAHDAASYSYGVLAVRLEGSGRKKAVDAISRHRTTADALRSGAAEVGVELAPAAPAYHLPALADAPAAVALAARLELDVADAGAALVASEVAELRTLGVEQLVTAGLSATIWAPLPPFPGMSELA